MSRTAWRLWLKVPTADGHAIKTTRLGFASKNKALYARGRLHHLGRQFLIVLDRSDRLRILGPHGFHKEL